MEYFYSNQRDIYKFVENLTSARFRTPMALLKTLVRELVNHKEFEITGGRIWELQPETNSYALKYQYGKFKRIPIDYSIAIADQPILAKLVKQRTFLQYETDALLQEKGIELYSVTGVGEIIRLKTGKFYKYAIGFNAPKILQSFFETLTIISSVATIALRNLSSLVQEKKIRSDFFKASEIQRNLLPEHHVTFLDYDVFGVCMPDSAVGGDYFDYIKSSDYENQSLSIIVSDAASKGLPAAIQSLFVSGAIKMGMNFSPKISFLLSRLNNLIFNTFPYERFVTLFYCELTNSSNRLVLYSNAGHCSPLHYHPDTGVMKQLQPTGGLLGIVEHQTFGVENIRMRPGDVMVIYTDGITDGHSADGDFYGTDRLEAIIKEHYTETSEQIAYYILDDVIKFTTGSSYTDDKTLVVIKRNAKVES